MILEVENRDMLAPGARGSEGCPNGARRHGLSVASRIGPRVGPGEHHLIGPISPNVPSETFSCCMGLRTECARWAAVLRPP